MVLGGRERKGQLSFRMISLINAMNALTQRELDISFKMINTPLIPRKPNHLFDVSVFMIFNQSRVLTME